MFLNRGPSSARATGAALAKARLSEQSAVRGCLPRPRPADRASRDVWAARLIYYSGWSRLRCREVRGDEIMRGTAECLLQKQWDEHVQPPAVRLPRRLRV